MNMKKIIAGALAFCVIGGTLSYDSVKINNNSIVAFAENIKGFYEQLTYTQYSDHVEISDCEKYVTEANIPAEINGLPVTVIAEEAFRSCTSLESLTIPDSVKIIGECAFYYCISLKSVVIPDSVTTIESSAFSRCESLETIVIPENLKDFKGGAFTGTVWLRNKAKENPLVIVNDILIDGQACSGDVVIPDGVTSIGDSAFSDCSKITSITIPDSVTYIGKSAFSYCTGLVSIVIPDSITDIKYGTFYSCKALESITIPESVKSIGNNAFYETLWLKNKSKENPFVIVNNILVSGEECTDTDIIIPDNVVKIAGNAFSDCVNIKSITIPDGVTEIGDYTFSSCEKLESIIIPDSVTSIGEYAFKHCIRLTAIKIPENVTSIENSVLSNCIRLETVILPDKITKIGNWSFWGCDQLKEITIPDTVKTIGNNAFQFCESFTEITIPKSVKAIGKDAFSDCVNLASIQIKNPRCEIFDSEKTIIDITTIYGYEGSTAQTYAEKYNRKFEALPKENEEEVDFPSPIKKLYTGDIDGDDLISASDASFVLMEYSALSTGTPSFFNEYQKVSGDVNNDGLIDAVDASYILAFYSYLSTGGEESDMKVWIETQE